VFNLGLDLLVVVAGRRVVAEAFPALTTDFWQLVKVLVQNEASLQSPFNSNPPQLYLVSAPVSILFI
jgi:hypothetical protein